MTKAISLPYPLSANRYWRIANNRVYASAEAKAYKKEAALAAKFAGFRFPASGPIEVGVCLHPKQTKSGEASKTRIDLDNCLKVALDALNGIAWVDDSQITAITAMLADAKPNGGLTIFLKPDAI